MKVLGRFIVTSVLVLLFSGALTAKVIRIGGVSLSVSRERKAGYQKKKAVLKKTVSVRVAGHSIQLRRGKEVVYNTSKKFIVSGYLAKKTSYRIAGRSFVFESGSKITFGRTYRGALYVNAGYLNSNSVYKIKGYRVYCKAAGKSYLPDIRLGSRGQIYAVTLARKLTMRIRGSKYSFASGSRLSYALGISGTLDGTKKVRVGRNSLVVKGSIAFYSSGNLLSVYLAKSQSVKAWRHSIVVKRGGYVSFYSNGKVHRVRPINKVRIAGRTVPSRHKVEFSRYGRIKKISRY